MASAGVLQFFWKTGRFLHRKRPVGVAAHPEGTTTHPARNTESAHQAGVALSAYELDFFGKAKSLSDAALHEYLATEQAQRAARIGVVAEVVRSYVQERAAASRVALARRILIVEFAKQLREEGMGLAEAAVAAARLRLRPILMTSLAFGLGVVPLMIAMGASTETQHAIGTGVFGGMVSATVLAIIFVPVFFVFVMGGRERLEAWRMARRTAPAPRRVEEK